MRREGSADGDRSRPGDLRCVRVGGERRCNDDYLGSCSPTRDRSVLPRCSRCHRGSLGAPLPVAQSGTWEANRYTCIYNLADGTLSLSVDVLANKHQAASVFADAQRDAPQRQRLNGLGQAAFQTPAGLFVARKDRFVISIDPSGLPVRINHSDVAFAAAVQLLNCWAGAR